MEGLLGNNVVVQIGMVVDDIEKATRAWAEFLGMEEPAIITTENIPSRKRSIAARRQRPAAGRAFFRWARR